MFVYTLKLDTNNYHHNRLTRRFKMTQDIYRKSILEILKREAKQKKDPRNKKIKDSYEKINSLKDQILNLNNDLETKPKSEQKTIKDNIKSFNKEIKELDKQIKALYKELDTDYDLRGSFSFGKFANNYRNARNYSNYIPSDVAIKLGMRAWDAYEKVKFKKGAKQINKYPELMSFEAKSDSGIIIRNGVLKMGTKGKGIEIPVIYKNDDFEREVFTNEFKFNRILRRFENNKWNYYVQMIFDGIPPQKIDNYLTGTVGIDVGITKVTISTPNEVKILPLAPELQNFDAEIRRLSRKLDRQRRANNPDNYNEDGTIKRGKKTWVQSKGYIKTKNKLANLKRKQAEYRKISHKTLANAIIAMGDKFIIKQSNFEELMKRSSETKVSKTGKFLSKKRAGKKIGNHAPAYFIQQLTYKAMFQGKEVITLTNKEFNPYEYNHVTQEFQEVNKNSQTRLINGIDVQRNLYAAFLTSQYENLDDNNAVQSNFETFLRNQELYLETA